MSFRPGNLQLLFLLPVVMSSLPQNEAAEPAQRVSFRTQVAPLLVKNCIGCHGDRKASGGLSMASYATLKRGGKVAGATIIEPGDPDSSYLIESIGPEGSPRMPYKLPPLAAPEIDLLGRWIKEGASYDGPGLETTELTTFVDVMAGLPKVVLKEPAVDPVSSVAFDQSGAILAAAVGRQVVLYDRRGAKPPVPLPGHPGPITSVAFSPDGKSLIVAGGRAGLWGFLTVWDAGAKRASSTAGAMAIWSWRRPWLPTASSPPRPDMISRFYCGTLPRAACGRRSRTIAIRFTAWRFRPMARCSHRARPIAP